MEEKVLLPHQKRVVDEFMELFERTNKLNDFIMSEAFKSVDDAEKKRLTRQLHIMHVYSDVLEERIDAFEGK